MQGQDCLIVCFGLLCGLIMQGQGCVVVRQGCFVFCCNLLVRFTTVCLPGLVSRPALQRLMCLGLCPGRLYHGQYAQVGAQPGSTTVSMPASVPRLALTQLPLGGCWVRCRVCCDNSWLQIFGLVSVPGSVPRMALQWLVCLSRCPGRLYHGQYAWLFQRWNNIALMAVCHNIASGTLTSPHKPSQCISNSFQGARARRTVRRQEQADTEKKLLVWREVINTVVHQAQRVNIPPILTMAEMNKVRN